jgi:hypothetical protein
MGWHYGVGGRHPSVPCSGGREFLEVVSVVYMQKWIHLVQKLRRNEYFQSHFLRVSFFAAGSTGKKIHFRPIKTANSTGADLWQLDPILR